MTIDELMVLWLGGSLLIFWIAGDLFDRLSKDIGLCITNSVRYYLTQTAGVIAIASGLSACVALVTGIWMRA